MARLTAIEIAERLVTLIDADPNHPSRPIETIAIVLQKYADAEIERLTDHWYQEISVD